MELKSVFCEYYSPLVYFAARLVRDHLAAEDIVTETFLKLWQKQDNFSSDKGIKAFLYITTRNACFNHLQQARYQARERESLRFMTDDSTDFVLNEITRAEVLREVFYLVGTLPRECRKIILMIFRDGLSNKEIASCLHLSVNTVRNQKTRGLRLLKERYNMSACVV